MIAKAAAGTILNVTRFSSEAAPKTAISSQEPKLWPAREGLVEPGDGPEAVEELRHPDKPERDARLDPDRAPEQEERDETGEAELRKDIEQEGSFEAAALRADKVEGPAENEEQERSPQSPAQRRPPALSPGPALVVGISHGDAADEHEERLAEIPGPQAVPGMVLELEADGVEQTSPR